METLNIKDMNKLDKKELKQTFNDIKERATKIIITFVFIPVTIIRLFAALMLIIDDWAKDTIDNIYEE